MLRTYALTSRPAGNLLARVGVRFAADRDLLIDGDEVDRGGGRRQKHEKHTDRGFRLKAEATCDRGSPAHTRGVGAAGISSGLRLRSRAYAAVNSTPT